MEQEILDEEGLEELAEEARQKEGIRVLDNMKKQYKALFGTDPDEEIPIAEIQEKIRTKLPRPYKL